MAKPTSEQSTKVQIAVKFEPTRGVLLFVCDYYGGFIKSSSLESVLAQADIPEGMWPDIANAFADHFNNLETKMTISLNK